MADNSDIFADAALRQRRLLEQLRASPVVDALGVVAPSGASGGKSADDELWTLTFTLDAWRIDPGDLQTRPLTIRRQVTDKELRRLRNLITPYTAIRIKARVVADSLFESPQGLLEAFVGIETSDAGLNEHAGQLHKPVTHEDPPLGVFTLDQRVDWFTAQAVWDGQPVSLNLSAKESAEVDEALKTAHALWESQEAWDRRVRDYAIQKLLPLKNDSWRDEDEVELSADQFEDRMTLEAITVYPDGSFDFWHRDGDLFWGHSIQISGSLLEGPTHADIPG